MAPGLDDLFVAVHRRRTAGEPVKTCADWDPSDRKEFGRRDKYVWRRQGREYDSRPGRGNDPPVDGAPREVITMAYQMLLHPIHGEDQLAKLAQSDPEMLDLALGALFRYDP